MKEKDSRFIVRSCIVVVFDCWLLLFSFNCHLGSWFHFYLLYSANIIFVIHSFLIKFRNNRANVRLDNVQNGFNDNEKIKTNIKGKWGYIPIIVQLIESFNYWYGIYIYCIIFASYIFFSPSFGVMPSIWRRQLENESFWLNFLTFSDWPLFILHFHFPPTRVLFWFFLLPDVRVHLIASQILALFTCHSS